jgi:hypothetical protein
LAAFGAAGALADFGAGEVAAVFVVDAVVSLAGFVLQPKNERAMTNDAMHQADVLTLLISNAMR